MNEELEKLKNRLHLRKQEIIHLGLKKLPEDYISLQQQITELTVQHAAPKTKASTNLFAKATANDSSTATTSIKIEADVSSTATAEVKIKP